jgi:hypothetical protein
MALSNFQVVVSTFGAGVSRFSRDNSGVSLGPSALAEIEAAQWSGPLDGFNVGPLTQVSMILSSFGNLEVVIVDPGGALQHYYRVPSGAWFLGATIQVPAGLGRGGGAPSLIQRSKPQPGAQHADFELLVPSNGGVVLHFTRHNDQARYPWTFDSMSGFGIEALGVALIESDYGNLECVFASQRDAELWHFYRDPVSFIWTPSTTLPITARSGSGLADGRLANPGAYGSPGMAQLDPRVGAAGPGHQNFEVVVPTPAGTLAHYYRDNSSETWFATEEFGLGNYATFVSLIKSSDFDSLEAIADGLTHYRRDADGGNWTQTATFAGDSAGGAAGFAEDFLIVYDNTTGPIGNIPNDSVPAETGGQITLAGDARFIRQVTIFFYCNQEDPTGPGGPGVTAQLRFYHVAGDGTPASPPFWQSPKFSVSLSQSLQSLSIAVNFPVPGTFIWTVASFGEDVEYLFWLAGSYPPTVGSCLPFAWAIAPDGWPALPNWTQLALNVEGGVPAPQAVFTASMS